MLFTRQRCFAALNVVIALGIVGFSYIGNPETIRGGGYGWQACFARTCTWTAYVPCGVGVCSTVLYPQCRGNSTLRCYLWQNLGSGGGSTVTQACPAACPARIDTKCATGTGTGTPPVNPPNLPG